MTSNNRLYIILGLTTLSIVLIVAVTHEYRKVVDADWKAKFELESKDPHGFWLFKELMTDYMSDAEHTDGFLTDTLAADALYIRIAERASIGVEKTDSLQHFLNAGNDAFIIADVFTGGIDTFFSEQYNCYATYGSGNVTFNFGPDSLRRAKDYSYIVYDQELDSVKKIQRHRVFSGVEEYDYMYARPLVYTYRNWTNNDYEEDYEYDEESEEDGVEDYSNESEEVVNEGYSNESEEAVKQPAIVDGNYEGESIIIKMSVGENGGSIYFCSLPELFTNITLQQTDVTAFFDDFVTTLPRAKTIYWDNSEGIYINNIDSESPLRFIMSQKSLRLGYFMLLGLTLLFIIFRSKRRQKVIPLRAKNKNTSLEYIDTLSKLYLSSGRHEKLVVHHEKIFFHEVERKYFIRKDHPDFVGVLSKKSRQPEDAIEKLLSRFSAARQGESFSTYQLDKVTERINSIIERQK